jgi:hypothetical protein
MMKITPWLSTVCCTALLAASSGCLFTRFTTNTVRKNEKPRAVTFESAQARNIFEGKLAESRANLSSNTANPRVVAVPFLLLWASTDVVSDTGIRNDQLAICDANGDGVITVDEASVYATKVDELIAKHNAEKAKNEAQSAGSPPTGPDTAAAPAHAPPHTVQPPSQRQPLEARAPEAPMPPGSYR